MPETPNEKNFQGGRKEPPPRVTPGKLPYAELDVTTNFSFLRGASWPQEMVYQAAELGYKALAITDINTLAGIVRAHEAAKKVEGFKLIIGCRLVFADGTPDILVWPTDKAAYARLARLLTIGKRRADKGQCHLTLDDFLEHAEGQQAAVCLTFDADYTIHTLRAALGDRLSIAAYFLHNADDADRLDRAMDLSRRVRVPLLATNAVHYHHPARRDLQDVLTCIRHSCTVQTAGYRLFANAERYLRTPLKMHRLFRRLPHALMRGIAVEEQCRFSLDDLRYDYPIEAVPAGNSPSLYLRQLTYSEGAKKYDGIIPQKVIDSIEKELKLICGSKYESYFLTVYDLVCFARSKNILCQGRGSAANSAVCYCLGITSVDPNRFELVFSRFASEARSEPPDIDVDFEHERREEVIQYIYEKYGRDRAAMTGLVITYRGRSAVRDVGKALGFSADLIDQLAEKLDWWHHGQLTDTQLEEAGLDRSRAAIEQYIRLVNAILGFPRHLSQHVGGMVISRSPLCEIVPIENAAMDKRTVIEWDKDDLDVLGLFKVDCLALGMLTTIAKSIELVATYDRRYTLADFSDEDPCVYDMCSEADTIGVFQIESRAQMSMLPRLRPRRFYDFVVEVAIVRPGPIQGGMVHPYLARREQWQLDPDNYRFDCENEKLRKVLKETLGVPLFQEQAMRMAVVAAGFTETEADQLRRSMAAWKRSEGLGKFEEKFIRGMLDNEYSADFAKRCFEQIKGFGSYGFPESHAASFARLVYASAWLKRHHPAAFCCALLNSQPMGFYAPAQLVRDAREHGVEVRPPDVSFSDFDCTLEHDFSHVRGVRTGPPCTWGWSGPALRLGLRQIKGVSESDAYRIAEARGLMPDCRDVSRLQHHTRLHPSKIVRLAEADAFASFGLSRRQALWQAMQLKSDATAFGESTIHDDAVPASLPLMPEAAEVQADYTTQRLSLRRHPVHFVRDVLTTMNVTPVGDLADGDQFHHGRRVKVAGLVLLRQRPGTASGIVFMTLEDETGIANLVIHGSVYERFRKAARHATLLQADGVVQRAAGVVHVLAYRLFDRTELLPGIEQASRDFH